MVSELINSYRTIMTYIILALESFCVSIVYANILMSENFVALNVFHNGAKFMKTCWFSNIRDNMKKLHLTYYLS